MKNVRGILINSQTETITEVYVNGDYTEIYRIINVDLFTVVNLDNKGNALFVDDEGLLKNPEFFFKWDGYHQPLAGNGLILGTDDEGESVSTTLTLEEVKARVTFKRLEVVAFEHREGVIDHPVLGPKTGYVGNRPVFRERK